MDHAERESPVDTVIGLSKPEATDVLVAEDDARDSEFVRTILDHVTDDGVVTEEAIDQTVADTSMVLSTAETRVELASLALSDAEETASDLADIDCVQARLSAFDAQVSALEDRVVGLGKTIQSLSAWRSDDTDLYDLVTGLRDVTSDAQELQRIADDLQTDLDGFERWVATADVRRDGLSEDVDAIEQALDGLTRAVEEIQTGDERTSDERTSDERTSDERAGDDWFDAMLRRHVVSLLVSDVRAELDDVREMAARQDVAATGLEPVADRLDTLDARIDDVEARLDSLARPGWTDRYDDRLASFESTLATLDPPVSWDEVQTALEAHRAHEDQ